MYGNTPVTSRDNFPISLRRTAIGNILWQVISISYVYLARLIALLLLARLLSPADFGIVALGNVVIGFGNLIGQLGVGNALIQKSNITERHINTAFWIAMSTGAILFGTCLAGAHLIAQWLRSPDITACLKVLSVAFLIVSASVVPRALLQRRLAFKAIAFLQVLSYTAGYLIIGVIMALFGYGYWALVGAYLTEAAINSLATIMICRFPVRLVFDLGCAKELLLFGGLQSLGSMLQYVGSQVDKAVVSYSLGTAGLGIYTRASYLSSLVASIVDTTLGRVGFAVASRVQNNEHVFREGVMRSLKTLSVVLFPTATLTAVLSPEIVITLLGKKWQPAIPLLQIFCVSVIWDSLSRLISYLLLAKDRAQLVAMSLGGYAAFMFVGVTVASRFGLSSIAWASTIALWINSLIQLYFLRKVSHLSIYELSAVFKPAFILAVMMFFMSWLIASLTRAAGLGPLATMSVTAVCSLLVVAWLIRFLPVALRTSVYQTITVFKDVLPSRVARSRSLEAGENWHV